ncbi:ornithine cyclodeaminase [Vibrio sp. B1FLJ16]|uniref:ornithine cyclodeaminase family protein n=1 Tax=Vibrio sp. B1FLJ16 TaxID=2751178 RepID=UPI0015F67B4E|nr:ornithine cyclodeaminase family protein [Vibrio sp. B1FLJ16]CAD7819679.1 ornithine cyclodeaminase [Vibrio sp. B1FLJ16]CAE6940046.1 ornithine cyclodeaminase [Vibrio sp. B1FLJ16]
MKFISADQVASHLPWNALINKLDETFRKGVYAPSRHHHTIERPDGEATMLLMPAWEQDGYIGMKMLNVFPQNSAVGLPSISGLYMLSEGKHGQTIACIAGNELTRRRTAAASALAARYLAKPSAETLLIVGTGQVAPMLIEAHAAVRPIKRVLVWGRNQDKAKELVTQYQSYQGEFCRIEDISVVKSLEQASSEADIISCATLSKQPIIKGNWLTEGTHLDLVGAFRKDMRECDGVAVERSDVYVDTWAGAMGEAGDLHQAVDEGYFKMDQILGDLEQLTRDEIPGRKTDNSITLFKSVGASLEDLAAAIVLWEEFNKQ